jgi:Putative bacterial sensory transduction regulator
MPLFDNAQEANFKACAHMVESVLQERGLDPAQSRIASEEGPAWGLQQGSAEVYIFLSAGDDGTNFIQVVAPVLVPASDTFNELMRRLLELNANELTGAAFGLREDEVVLTADRSTLGLDRVELEEMLKRVASYADHYDDILTVEYGGTRHSDA